MGAAQFLPSTWLRFESRVSELTNHYPPSPWNAGDAFTAAAIFLSQAGASSQTLSGELAAARTYISGSSTCGKSICWYYSNRIIALSREIDRIL
jgi:membrane-bound lytic murein transglycosylase B